MRLQHERRPARRWAIALEPPGNCARDLALYRRTLFAALGESSALAFPELAFLAWLVPSGPRAASRDSRGKLKSSIQACWRDVEGPFSTAGLVERGDAAYLGLASPAFASLAANGSAWAASYGNAAAPDASPPIEPGIGFFLCMSADPKGSQGRPALPAPPRLSFLDCSLVLLDTHLVELPDRLLAASWRVLARSRRLTGP